MTKSSRHRGFTLIELLVVIAIIAILAALLLPALGCSHLTPKSLPRTRASALSPSRNRTLFYVAVPAWLSFADFEIRVD